ncbi:uncharacterized protein LDX57_001620 [Aspergillus melleus]|uniref:uncharacterized protein n=1 Tax=Aspergillus melleus TaxID=138277 RepID=UPI001E8D89FE|nr:uncharacterized protein LDX57_001620 [Aspergillus melleus]KAH8423868.1 hypothetical protein LDX57_001620 [Aspergillus melleus]
MKGSKRKQPAKKKAIRQPAEERTTRQTRSKRKVCVQKEPSGSEKSPRPEITEDELTAHGKTCSESAPATSEPEANHTPDLEEGITGLDREEPVMEQLGYHTRVNSFLEGGPAGWIDGVPGNWPSMFNNLYAFTSGFPLSFGIEMEDFNKLPKEDRQAILESVKGYVIQGDVDEVAAQFSENTYDTFSECLLSAFLSDYVLRALWGGNGRFWWLESDTRAKDTQNVPSAFGGQLNSLYQEFVKAHRHFAYVWAMMTIRLSTITDMERGRDYTFGKSMDERRRSLIRSTIIPDLLSKKTMQLLLKDAKSPAVSDRLQEGLETQAENAALMYSYPYAIRFEGIELPSNYVDLPERVRTEYKHYFKGDDDSPLHGKKVLGIRQPAIYRQGTFRSPNDEVLISPGTFVINWNYQDGRDIGK